MTDPADLHQLCHTVSLQGATIRRHEELVQGLLEGLRSLTECHDQGLKAIMEKIRELAQRLPATSEKSQSPSNFPLSVVSLYSLSWLPENPAYLLRSNIQGILVPGRVLSQCSLIFELQPSSFPSDRSKIAYIITLMLGRALSRAMAVWEQ